MTKENLPKKKVNVASKNIDFIDVLKRSKPKYI